MKRPWVTHYQKLNNNEPVRDSFEVWCVWMEDVMQDLAEDEWCGLDENIAGEETLHGLYSLMCDLADGDYN